MPLVYINRHIPNCGTLIVAIGEYVDEQVRFVL
jgi:hypothetical protein